jgi:hypothetical protein
MDWPKMSGSKAEPDLQKIKFVGILARLTDYFFTQFGIMRKSAGVNPCWLKVI